MGGAEDGEKIDFSALSVAAKSPTVWFLGLIIFFSYTAYSLADYLTPYSTNICGLSVAAGATLSMVRTYAIGPFGAFFGGVAADRFTTSNTMIVSFLLVIACNLAYIFFPGSPRLLTFVITNMVICIIDIICELSHSSSITNITIRNIALFILFILLTVHYQLVALR